MPRRATTERKQLRIPDLTIESCGIQVNIAILTCAMCAWVRTIALRLALGSHGYYLYLRAGFDRFKSVSALAETLIRRPGAAEAARITVHQHQTLEGGTTIAGVNSEGRQHED